MALILTGSSGSTTLDSSAGLTFSDSSNQQYAASPYVLKNRLINGNMVIDQRNAGASVTPTNTSDITYNIDRWNTYCTVASKFSVQQNAGSVTPPIGFSNYLGITSLSSYSVSSSDQFWLSQRIEGFNIADLAWGTANAKTVTLSFQVYSSLTGSFGGCLSNGTYYYPFSYTISSANTWTSISVTIVGSTAGTWNTTNGIGIRVIFGLGVGSSLSGTAGSWANAVYIVPTGSTSVVGTNGATWYLTGVQLEVGSTATPFERRLYNQELANCQRYYYYLGGDGSYNYFGIVSITSTTNAFLVVYLPVTMRSSPTLSYVGTVGNFDLRSSGNNQHFLTAVAQDQSSTKVCGFSLTTSGLTANTPGILIPNNSTANQLTFNAEL